MGAVVVLGGSAWAHVEVVPESAPKGSDAVLSFTVPDESETASTTKVEVFFPTDHPIAEALVQPIAGWTATVATMPVTTPIQTDDGSVTEAVKSVTWTGGKIEPGNFQNFSVSVGLPDVEGELQFKTLQTYSDGNIVRWIEATPPGGEEPENPAPVLTLTAGDEESATPTTVARSGAAAKEIATKSDVDSAKGVAIVALIVGILGLLVAVGGFVLSRRNTAGG
jgi:uncharacterized protein YcnI